MTRYVVLSQEPSQSTRIMQGVSDATKAVPETVWKTVKMVEAASAKAAVSLVVKEQSTNGTVSEGTFVAVPVRSWEPIKVKAETKVSIKFT